MPARKRSTTEETVSVAEEKVSDYDEQLEAIEETEPEDSLEPGEADVEADIEEVVSETDLERDTQEIQGERTEELPTRRRERPSRRAREENRVRRITAEQEEIANESALRSAVRTGRVFTGEVAAVEELSFGGESQIAAIVVMEKRFKVTVPFSELFTVSPIDMSTVDLSTSDGRYEYMRRTRMFAE